MAVRAIYNINERIHSEDTEMKIAFGCDHRGYILKDAILAHLRESGHEVVDMGTDSTERVDYPVYGEKVGRAVACGECALGIVVCGTGFGI